MTIKKYGNQYFSGIRYSFLGDRVSLSYEIDYDRSNGNSFVIQFGGDVIFWKSITLFGRTLSFEVTTNPHNPQY